MTLENQIGDFSSRISLGICGFCMGTFLNILAFDDKSQPNNLLYLGTFSSAIFLGSLAFVKYSDEIKNKKEAVINNVVSYGGVMGGMFAGYFI